VRPFRGRSGGFSLIEVMAAISVFAIITLGITPLLVSSIRGTDLSRSLTRSKNLVSEAMERVRGLPYYDTGVNRDVLDLYFPNLVTSGAAGYSTSAATYTTICTSTSKTPTPSANLGCPPPLADGSSRIPPGYTITFTAAFVDVAATVPETYTVKTPLAGYVNTDPAAGRAQSPLLRMSIKATWTHLGRPRQFELTSIIGDRRLSPDKARATANIDFVIESLTSYKNPDNNQLSRLTATAGRALSDVEIRNLAAATTEARAAELSLTSQELGGIAGRRIDTVTGAQSQKDTAPANKTFAQITDNNSDKNINHDDLFLDPLIAFLDDGSVVNSSSVPPAGVQVINNLPRAVTNFSLNPASQSFWADNQADFSTGAAFKLDPAAHILTAEKKSNVRVNGSAYAEVTDLNPGTSRKVEASLNFGFGRLFLMPTTFVTATPGAVLTIEDFTSTLTCIAKGSAGAGTATGSWSATVKYWRDSNPNDNIALGSYQPVDSTPGVGTEVLEGSTTSTFGDALSALQTSNPLVYDSVVNSSDVYLFEDAAAGKIGYFRSMDSTERMNSALDATTARVDAEAAIRVVTARTDPANEESALAVSIGKASCQAVDNRG
jgi:prepilin-type N-terminal cleavage/methylation domain-containing protein